MELNIKPEDIDNLVKDALLKSAFGKTINEAVTKMFSGYNNPMESELRKLVTSIVAEILNEKHKEQTVKHVSEYVSKAVSEDVLQKITDKVVSNIIKSAQDDY